MPQLALDRATFRYPATEAPVLVDVSLEVSGGEVVALVGSIGAGASTLLLVAGDPAPRVVGGSPEGRVVLGGGALRALAVPLILSALHEVDERALALETRRLVPGARRTPLSPPRDHGVERVTRWALAAACAAALAWRLR